MEKEKTIYDLGLHEALAVKTNLGSIEITRVPGGWIYAFEYPAWRQSPTVFVPFVAAEKKVKRSLNYTGPVGPEPEK